MQVAQSGIFALGTGSHSYLEFDLHAYGGPLTLVQVMASLGEPRMTTGGVNLVALPPSPLWRGWLLVAVPYALDPFGAKGVGEPPVVPVAAAITNAIKDAVGVRMTQIPMTPERVFAALREEK